MRSLDTTARNPNSIDVWTALKGENDMSNTPRTKFRMNARSIALMATAALVAVGATACSSADEPQDEGPVELTFQVWGDTGIAEKQWESYAEAFPEEAEGVTMNVVSAGDNDGDAMQKLRLQLASGEDVPDIVQLNYSALPEFAESGVLTDVKPYVEDYLGNVTAAADTLMQYKDQYLAIPYEVKEKLWFYRTDLFEQAGIDVTQVKTQDDFIEAGEKLKAVAPNSSIWNIGPNPPEYVWAQIVSGNGARYSQQEPCEFVIAGDEGTADAFRAMKELRESGVVNTTFDDFSPEWQAALADGTVASVPIASWFPQFLQSYAPDLAGKWAVTTWPEIGGAVDGAGSGSGGSIFVIPTASEHPEEAAEFLAKSMMTKEGSLAFATANPGYLPNVPDALNDPSILENEYFGTSLVDAFIAAADTYEIFPYDPASLKTTQVLQEQMVAYLASDEEDPASFLQAAQDELTAQVGCPYTS
ncbi:ABC transporter substrate-binding protein [Microbacterium sp. NPDC057407]|uniref:ABC transporter substrate-binding protein n=1 Tax=Microbacterium sp. NPDC057407 TaxID=3346120 RepID=UPI00366C3F72